MRISDWSSDVCSSDLRRGSPGLAVRHRHGGAECDKLAQWHHGATDVDAQRDVAADPRGAHGERQWHRRLFPRLSSRPIRRSEEHTSELQSLMRNSYAVFCLKKKKNQTNSTNKRN